MDLIKDNVLATDLALHLGILEEINGMAEEGYSRGNARHRFLLNSLVMTSCDLCSSTKSWDHSFASSVGNTDLYIDNNCLGNSNLL